VPVKRAANRPVVITDAETSRDDQLRARQIRYASMMGLRVVCLITGAVLAVQRVPLWWLWLPLCIAGMVLLPWMAVLVANDRPPKTEHTLAHRLRRRPAPDPATPTPALPAPHPTIDQDSRDDPADPVPDHGASTRPHPSA
jgi:hypothetical protein